MAKIMLGIRTQQLTLMTSNRALHFRRDPGAFILRFAYYVHSSSYALPQLTSRFSTERGLGSLIADKGAGQGYACSGGISTNTSLF